MHIKHLQSFLTAARLLNFGEAARTQGPPIPIQAQMIFHREKWLTPPVAALEKLVLAEITRSTIF